jgi:putative glutamine amidotransferase
MGQPLIGLTTYGCSEQNAFSLPAGYVDAVRRAGGIPLLLAPGEPALGELLATLDGFILPGGGDVEPSRYAGRPHETIYMVDAERDATELALVQGVCERRIPLFGICRGTQVVNVALGGTLIEHLPDIVGDQVPHRLPPHKPAEHVVRVQTGSRLATILGETEFACASWHHQAIRDVAPGLNVVARAPDGTIEAVEMPGHPWLIAVQWHPELTAATDPIQQRLFDHFVGVCAQRRSQRDSSTGR